MLRIAVDEKSADCVKSAVLYFSKDRLPDLVISGLDENAGVICRRIESGRQNC